MAHYAFLDTNNIVTQVIVGIDETELIEGLDPETWYGNFSDQVCKRTSYNAATNGFRKQYAGIGYSFDPVRNEFVLPQPFESWTLDENNDWQPPTPKPTEFRKEDQRYWDWNEEELEWVAVNLGG
jgi:hypothetical protein